MATITIKRKPGSTLLKMTTAAFNMQFPLNQDTFEVPANYYAYLQQHFDVVESTKTGDSGKKPCWYKDSKIGDTVVTPKAADTKTEVVAPTIIEEPSDNLEK